MIIFIITIINDLNSYLVIIFTGRHSIHFFAEISQFEIQQVDVALNLTFLSDFLTFSIHLHHNLTMS